MDIVFFIFLAIVVCATVWFVAWGILIRPILYSAGWVRPTAHDLEVEGWQAERADDIPRALQKYAESLTLDPCNPHLLARVDELLDANEWIRFEWPDVPNGGR